jgi:hypothetical protein
MLFFCGDELQIELVGRFGNDGEVEGGFWLW